MDNLGFTGTSDSVLLTVSYDMSFGKQLRETVRRLHTPHGRQRFPGVQTEVVDQSDHTKVLVPVTCWRIPLTDDYFVDSDCHLVKKGKKGSLLRIDCHSLRADELLQLIGILRSMEYAIEL